MKFFQAECEGDQPWDFFGRNDAKAETPVLWPPDAKSWLVGKDPDAGRDWWQEEKGTTEDEMAGWHHWLDGREFEWTLGVGDGQGGLACCDSWGHKESDTTEQLNWTDTSSFIGISLNYWFSCGFQIQNEKDAPPKPVSPMLLPYLEENKFLRVLLFLKAHRIHSGSYLSWVQTKE